MVHLGDITKMSGYTIPPVDVITFGSPCQDLSIAGKRAGMAGERSGLFSEAVRIIREMRYATFGAYPKYAVCVRRRMMPTSMIASLPLPLRPLPSVA